MTATQPDPSGPKRRLRWYQFSLRALLVLVLLFAILFAAVGVRLNRARRQELAYDAVLAFGGQVAYDYRGTGAAKPPGPAWLQKLAGEDLFASVIYVDLGGCQITDSDLANLVTGLAKLKVLDLGFTQVTDEGLAHLSELTNLEELHLLNTKITDAGLRHLARLPKLRVLTLGGTRITDPGLRHLARLPKLQVLTLEGTRITDAGLEHLKGLLNLKIAVLDRTEVSGEGMKELQQALPNTKISH